ncbi:hypothetical protein BpHYR1_045407 [Brachionus plicatilis]|uniref:Uncharacterized protein n=1 Tax=Brachionus plicatilis TaxID=10195 RepID=A0A3M7SLF7_BRAPC|nr:hypothetical protein BpHYR1_045407 [Brachionus plicatilis]
MPWTVGLVLFFFALNNFFQRLIFIIHLNYFCISAQIWIFLLVEEILALLNNRTVLLIFFKNRLKSKFAPFDYCYSGLTALDPFTDT